MTQTQEKAIYAISEHQKPLNEYSTPWMVGEQLKDMCAQSAADAEIILQDLDVPDMSLANAEKKIKAWADKQKRTGNGVGVPPNVAEGILREFYGLGKPAERRAAEGDALSLDLTDFL
jgi:hypothetical protein